MIRIVTGDMITVATEEAKKGRKVCLQVFASEDRFDGAGQVGQLLKRTTMSCVVPPAEFYPLSWLVSKGFTGKVREKNTDIQFTLIFVPALKWDLIKATHEEKMLAFRARAETFRQLAEKENPDVLICGAWGCGIYGTPARVSAAVQFDALQSLNAEIIFAFHEAREKLGFVLEARARPKLTWSF